MLAEFVSSIVNLAKSDSRFERFVAADEAELVRLPDGSVREVERLATLQSYKTEDFDSFVSLLSSASTQQLVCIQTNRVVGYFDKKDRREKVELMLDSSAECKALFDLSSFTSHKEAVHIVRDMLFDAAPPDLLPSLRSVDFTRRNDGSKSVEHGRESLGRSVEETVQSKSGQLQEFYEFNFPIYRIEPFSGFQCHISTSLDTDVTNEKVRFLPHRDDFYKAFDRASKFVRKELEAVLPSEAEVLIASHKPIARNTDED